mmetsp:Transcript_31384/g.66844  ORF Transcript_31384/g.66844 Transcript_31384/m.66844 type:complete len:97 (+) Transcript_31384:211-501(+)
MVKETEASPKFMMGICNTLCCCCIRRKREQYSHSDVSEGLLEKEIDSPSTAAEDVTKSAPLTIEKKSNDIHIKEKSCDDSSLSSSVGVSTLFMPLI